MSIEIQLERIANALETLVGMKDVAAPAIETPKAEVAKAKVTVPKGAPVIKKAETVMPEPVAPVKTEVVSTITKELLTEALRNHASNGNAENTKALMIKHGANATTPKIDSIPVANYAALYAEVMKK